MPLQPSPSPSPKPPPASKNPSTFHSKHPPHPSTSKSNALQQPNKSPAADAANQSSSAIVLCCCPRTPRCSRATRMATSPPHTPTALNASGTIAISTMPAPIRMPSQHLASYAPSTFQSHNPTQTDKALSSKAKRSPVSPSKMAYPPSKPSSATAAQQATHAPSPTTTTGLTRMAKISEETTSTKPSPPSKGHSRERHQHRCDGSRQWLAGSTLRLATREEPLPERDADDWHARQKPP